MRVAQKKVANSAHNVANASTSGFQPRRLDQADTAGGGAQITGSTQMPGGPLVTSGRALDLAVNGGGFFALNNADGDVVYSRNGKFMLNDQGQVADSQGRILRPPFQVPDNAANISVTPNGRIQALADDGAILAEGQIQTTTFANPGGLEAIGGNVYRETQASGPPVDANPGADGHGNLVSGAFQASGTDYLTEMTTQIVNQRSFEANLKAIQTHDEMLGTLLDKKT
jgi:flagellar basal body rod protein FlgG